MAAKLGNCRILVVMFGVLLAQVSAAAVHRPAHRLVIERIQQLEGEWRQAQLAADIQAMDQLLSDDFLGITAAGTVVTKAQQLERMRTRQLVIKELNIADTKIKLINGIAIVTSLAAIDGTAAGEPVKGSFRYTRVYQRLANGDWKITSFEATRIPHGETVAAGSGREFGVPH